MPAGIPQPRLDRDQDLERRNEFLSNSLVVGGPRVRTARHARPCARHARPSGRAVATWRRPVATWGRRSVATWGRNIATWRRAVASGRRTEAGRGRRRRGTERGGVLAALEGGLRSGRFQRLEAQDRSLRRSQREFGGLPHDDLLDFLALLEGAGLAQVLEQPADRSPGQPGMPTGDRRIADHDAVVGQAPDQDGLPGLEGVTSPVKGHLQFVHAAPRPFKRASCLADADPALHRAEVNDHGPDAEPSARRYRNGRLALRG